MGIIQFSHSNGFPAKSYTTFFQHLPGHYDLHYVNKFGTGPFPVDRGWQQMTQELKQSVLQHGEPVIGLGHSLGAVLTLKLAALHPELFKVIILMEPPLVHGQRAFMHRIAQIAGFTESINPLAKRALQRKDTFESREEAFSYFQGKKLFQSFHPDCFQDYITHGLEPKGDRLQLAIPKEIESQIFKNLPTHFNWNINVPLHFLYSNRFPVIPREVVNFLKKKIPQASFIPFEDGGHMYPLEKPEECAKLISKILNGI